MQEEQEINESAKTESASKSAKAAVRKKGKKRRSSKKRRGSKKSRSTGSASSKRMARPYPASSFQEALPLAEAIHEIASGERVRRLTLLSKLDKSPTSSSTRMLITNSTRYGLTKGGYEAEWLELTELGAIASNPHTPPREKLETRFKLAIANITPWTAPRK